MKKYLKINWGTGIFISIMVFMIIVIYTTVKFMNLKVDLVTENYYAKTLTYQEQIDIQKRTSELNEKVLVVFADHNLILSFPESYIENIKEVELYFYRPSDSDKDFRVKLNLDKSGEQVLNTSSIEKGYWKVELLWKMNNESYSLEKSIIVY